MKKEPYKRVVDCVNDDYFERKKYKTPLTDAVKIKFKTLCGKKYWVPVGFAKGLEVGLQITRKELEETKDRLNECRESLDLYSEMLDLILEEKNEQ